MADGQDSDTIPATLATHYNIDTTPAVIKAMEKILGLTAPQAQSLAIQRELAVHRAEAIDAYAEHRELYLNAKRRLSPGLDPEEAAVVLDEMRFAADQYGKWWDRWGRHLPIGATPEGSTSVNILQVIAEETRNGRINIDTFDRIIDRFDGPQPPPAAPAQVPRPGAPHDPGQPEPPVGPGVQLQAQAAPTPETPPRESLGHQAPAPPEPSPDPVP